MSVNNPVVVHRPAQGGEAPTKADLGGSMPQDNFKAPPLCVRLL